MMNAIAAIYSFLIMEMAGDMIRIAMGYIAVTKNTDAACLSR
jgi:hypothetical protein